MNIFDFDNYKKFVLNRLANMPKRGHGQFRKMAIFLAINSVNVTQIFKGDRNFTTEQACHLCEYFGFSDLEGQYFVGLVEHERAGSTKLKKMIERRLADLKLKSVDLKQRLPQSAELSEENNAIYYSNWLYVAINLLTSMREYQSADALSEYFGVPLQTVNRILRFLLQTGLCVEDKGTIKIGPASLHLEASSPLVSRHHANWRLKAIERMDILSSEELALTMPTVISEKALKEIKMDLLASIDRATKIIDDADCEIPVCLNIDLFRF